MQGLIRQIFENAIQRYHEDTQYEYTDKISVTEALYCLRKAYYYRTIDLDKYEEIYGTPPFSDTDFYQFVGKVVHSKLQEYIRTTAVEILGQTEIGFKDVLHEVEIENDVLIGHIDLIIRTGWYDIPLELKTCKVLPKKAYPQHKYQLSTYMVLGKEQFDFKVGYIVYISRTQGDIKIVSVAPKKERYLYVMERAKKLLDHIKRKEPPEPEDDPFCWKCPFRQICKGR